MADENQSGLSASEQAYFESGGATEIVPEAAPATVDQPGADQILQEPAKQEQQPRDENGKFIPHSVFHAEREEHKKTKAIVDDLTTKYAVLEDRWNTVLKLKDAPKEEPQAPPDPNEDIFAFSKWQADQIKALSEKVEGREKQEEQARTIDQQERDIWGHWSQSANAYAAEKTDFGDAVKFLSEARTKQLAALGRVNPNLANDQGRLNQINAELRQIVLEAKQTNQNPAEVVYEMATAWGYAPTAPTAPDPGKLELPKQLAQIEAAQNASRTLATPGGRSATDPMTAETIAAMSAPEFETWIKAPGNERIFQQMMGG